MEEVIREKDELGKAHSETIRVRELWNEVLDDMEKEFYKVIAAKEELRAKQQKIYEVETLLEELTCTFS